MLARLRQSLRVMWISAWLGWQIESNWTNPVYFLGLSVLRPVASVMILVFMYRMVSQVSSSSPMYAYIYLGNAFYIYVGAVMAGVSYCILDDREHYRTLKYLYVAPLNIPVYLVGRALARFITGSLAVAVTLLAGVLFFHVPITLQTADWLLFAAAMALGLACLIFMGITVGSWTLTIRTEPWAVGESVAAALYLFSGAIFPISILPAFLQPLGFLLPVTYWLELVRRALLGPAAMGFPTLAALSNAQLLGILAAFTVVLGFLSVWAFRFFEHVARERSMLDATSGH
jgi:ABC-2 type transport system permease protein